MARTTTSSRPAASESRSAVLQVSYTFPWQSWFDSTLLEQAIAVQPAGTTIVSPQSSQYGGHSLILHPSSQCPIAVTSKALGGGGAPTVYVLKPGQSVSPLGGQPLRTFTWGLPYGWLGGGMATLLVAQQPSEPSNGFGAVEIPFHRARFAIKQPTDLTTSGYGNSPLNWPIRFPWVQSFNSGGIAQPGQPILAPEPTRIVMVLRGLSTLGANANMRAIIQGADDLDLDAGGVAQALTVVNPAFEEFTWNAWTSIGTSGNLATQNPAITIDLSSDTGKALMRLGCSGVPVQTTAVGVTFVDDSGSGLLAGAYVDVIRYGRL